LGVLLAIFHNVFDLLIMSMFSVEAGASGVIEWPVCIGRQAEAGAR